MTYPDFIKKVKKNKRTELQEFTFINHGDKIEVLNNDSGKSEEYETASIACHVYKFIITRSCHSIMKRAVKNRIVFKGYNTNYLGKGRAL
jgi:hypothetical protein